MRVFGVDPADELDRHPPAHRRRAAERRRAAPHAHRLRRRRLLAAAVRAGRGRGRATGSQAALELLGIEELAGRVPHNLSGGEKRKVALAGALVMEPELLVLDEPFEGLDPAARVRARRRCIERLARERGVTIVMSTHDIDSVPRARGLRVRARSPAARSRCRARRPRSSRTPTRSPRSNIKPPMLAELFAALRDARRRARPSVGAHGSRRPSKSWCAGSAGDRWTARPARRCPSL